MQQHLPKRLFGQLPAKLLASSAVVILAICALVYVQAQSLGLGSTSTANSGGGIALQPPAFLQTVYAQGDLTAFDDAGIIAYVNIGREIDLDLIRDSSWFNSVTENKDKYITWDMSPPGGYESQEAFDEYTDVKMFVHQEGWIFAYLASNRNASLLIDWIDYNQNGLKSTTLENSIREVVPVVGAKNSDLTMSYYHFQHPDATDLMLIADKETYDKETDTFDVKVPFNFKLYEASWAHAAVGMQQSICRFNDEILNTHKSCYDCWRFKQGIFTQENLSKLKSDNFQEFSIYHEKGYDFDVEFSACGIALLYKRD